MKQVKIINLLINYIRFDLEESILNLPFYLAESQILRIFFNVRYLDEVKFKYLYSDFSKAKDKKILVYETTLMNAALNNGIIK